MDIDKGKSIGQKQVGLEEIQLCYSNNEARTYIKLHVYPS